MKVYGKPPLPPQSLGKGKPPKLLCPIGRRTTDDGGGDRQRSTSLADISQSTTLIPEAAGQVDSRRKQSAPALLAYGVRVNAKVMHQLKPKPRSASSIRSKNTSMSISSRASSGTQDLSVTSSLNSTPTHLSKAARSTMALEFREEGENLSLDPPPPRPPQCLDRGILTEEDEFLLSQSDELCREVMSLCQGNQHPDASCDLGYSIGHGGGEEGLTLNILDMNGELLSSLPCLSLASSLGNTPIPTSRASPPPSPHPPIRDQDPSSPEYDYKKVFGILRMIEEEEAKGSEIASCFGEFLREKVIGGGRTSSEGGSCASSRIVELGEAEAGRAEDVMLTENQVKETGDLDPANEERPFSSLSSPFPGGERGDSFQKESIPQMGSPVSESSRSRPENFRIDVRNCDGGQRSSSRSNAILSEWDAPPVGERNPMSSRSSLISEPPWETTDGKAKNLFSFLDEVEQSDRDFLFSLKFDASPRLRSSEHVAQGHVPTRPDHPRGNPLSKPASAELTTQVTSKLDSLIRKGSAELARDLMMLERQAEDSAQNIHVLEETLLSQRELNIRNMKNSEKEMKKRLKLQQEEFDLTLSRHQAFLDQIINEKRALQEKCEKILKESKVNEEKFQSQLKSVQEKHLEEIKRLRKVQENVEKNKKHQWVGQKTQEIRDMTVKGLEPEVQRLIQRHQQEMAETRSYYADEIQEIEERYARKQTQQLQELRENFHREKEESVRRERDLFQKRYESELQRQSEDFETQKRRLVKEAQEDKERLGLEEIKIRENAQENVWKGQIKCEVEVDNLRQEYELKMANVEKRHEKEIQSLRDNFESQRENWILTFNKKNEQILQERESRLIETLNLEKEREGREREKKVKEEYERIRKEEETVQELRVKRLQEKFQSELEDLERSERELKTKFSSLKTELIGKEEELFSLRTTLGLKTKENQELSESNFKMAEERVHLTSIIRREFSAQIESLEEDCRGVKGAVVELQSKHKLDLESHSLDLEKLRAEKDAEIERIGVRVRESLGRKEEMISELGKQLEKSSIRVHHLENLLEEQRKNFVKSVVTSSSSTHPKPLTNHRK